MVRLPIWVPTVLLVLQAAAVPTEPVVASIFLSVSSPYHLTVVKVAEKISLSVSVMFGVEVAAAAAAPMRTCILASASLRPETTSFGSWALKYLPWPLMAACHRSSTRSCTVLAVLPVSGLGQT
jgi:putative exporter of polyketide antibiotics